MRRAAVTAGTGRIGLETALAPATAGYTVTGRDAERGARAVERINGVGESALFLQADLSQLDDVRWLAERIAAEGGVGRAGQQRRGHVRRPPGTRWG